MNGILTPKRGSLTIALVLGIGYILFFGFRPHQNLGDTEVYVEMYEFVQKGILPSNYGEQGSDRLWTVTSNNLAVAGFPVESWFILVAAAYILPTIFAIKKLMPLHIMAGVCFFISCFGFFSSGTNGIRNAVACSITFLAIASLLTNKKYNLLSCGLLLFIALNIHFSVIMTITGLTLSYFFVKDFKGALWIWLGAIVLTLLMGNSLASYVSALGMDDRAASYLTDQDDAKLMTNFSHTGFRWDFLLFSAMPILLGWYVLKVKRVVSRTYTLLINTYTITNAIWVIFIYAAFSNRFAMLSWALYPFVLCYPLMKFNIWGKDQSLYTTLILFAQLAFSIII